MNEDSVMLAKPVKKLVWELGLPMIFSMIAQALYNVVDTAFVINMPGIGADANLALTYAFPVQIAMIAVGVGLGIGVNALLSRSLGQGDKKAASQAAGNGLFLGFLCYLIFLVFGLFLTRPFISMEASGIADADQRAEVIDLGTTYLSICTTLSVAQMLFTVYERFLQATGRTMLSTIGQLSGALLNILLDYVMIYPMGLGVAGAAYATVIGQTVSLILDMVFHYWKDKEIDNHLSYLKPRWKTICEIGRMGLSAMVMQLLLSIMMLGVNLILSTSAYDRLLLTNAFGIYYKIQQIALFACFGMSNALISLTSFYYGKGEKERLNDIRKYGIRDSLIVALVITVLFEALAEEISQVFNLASGGQNDSIVSMTVLAIRLGSIGFVLMAYTVSIQGILQGLREALSPLLLSALRLAVFVFPLTALFLHFEASADFFWLVFPLSELLTSGVSFFLLKAAFDHKVKGMAPVLPLVEKKA
jgi:multidrug efflux pump